MKSIEKPKRVKLSANGHFDSEYIFVGIWVFNYEQVLRVCAESDKPLYPYNVIAEVYEEVLQINPSILRRKLDDRINDALFKKYGQDEFVKLLDACDNNDSKIITKIQ